VQSGAWLLTSAGALGTALPDPVDVRLTVDEGWQPHVQASVVIPGRVPVDPRTLPRVTLTLSATETGGPASYASAERLVVRTAEYDARAGTTTLELASDEARVQDRAWLGAPLGPATWPGVREALRDLLVTYCAADPARIDLAALGWGQGAALVSGWTAQTGDHLWRSVQDIPQRIGWHVYVDLDGTWRLAPAAPTPPTTPTFINIFAREVLDCRETTTREGTAWADSVVARYVWRDAAGVEHRIVGTSASTTPPGGTKTLVLDSDVAVTQQQADARASQQLTRMHPRGRTFAVTVAGRLDLRDRTWVRLVTPAGETLTLYVAAVSWALPAGTCALTLREL